MSGADYIAVELRRWRELVAADVTAEGLERELVACGVGGPVAHRAYVLRRSLYQLARRHVARHRLAAPMPPRARPDELAHLDRCADRVVAAFGGVE